MRHRAQPIPDRIPRVVLLAVLSLAVVAAAVAPAVLAQQEQAATDEDVAERVARGRVSYRLYCRSCHGERATGGGPVADLLKVPPPDLTRIAERNGGEFPAEKIRQMIDGREEVKGHGDRDMPVWGLAFRVVEDSEDEAMVQVKIERLVHYLESLQVQE